MVGGVVIEIILLADRVWIDCRDRAHTCSTCAIYVERNADSEAIRVGDSVWWQGTFAFWTPTSHEFEDRKIERIGFSGVERPNIQESWPEVVEV